MLATHARRLAPPRIALAVAGLALLAATPLAAQDSGPANQDESVQQLRQELQQVGQQVAQLRQKALQDSTIQQEQLALQQVIEKKMNTIDGKTSDRTQRMGEIRTALQKARQAQDTTKLRSLITEAQQIQAQLRQTQMKAMQDEEIATQLDTFRSDLIGQMKEIDPRADSLMSRMQELQKEIQQQAAGGQGAGGGLER